MKLKRAYGKDFGPFENIDINFDKINGLTMIEGWNEDDNSASGAGKTFVMDLISFVPFGESPRGLKVNEFINDNATKGCLAGLELEMDNGSTLTIERSRKPEDLHYTIDNGDPVRGGNIKETQTMIEELLKLDFNTFVNSVYFTQNANMNFIEASDTEKRDILTRILDLSDFDKAYEIADNKIKLFESAKSNVKIEIDKVNMARNMCVKDLEDLTNKSKAFDTNQKGNIAYKNTTIALGESKIKEINLMIDFLSNKKFDVPAFNVTQPDISGLDKEQEQLRNIVFPVINMDSVAREGTADLDEKAADLIKKVAVKPKLEIKIKEIEKQRTEIRFEFDSNRKKIEKIEKTGTGECPECFQSVNREHLDKHKAELNSRNEVLRTKIEELNYQKYLDTLEKVLECEKDLNNIEIERNRRERAYSAAVKALADKQKAQDNEKLLIERKIASFEQTKQTLLREYAMAEKLHAEKIKQVEIEKADNVNRIKEQHNLIERLDEQILQLRKDIKDLEDQENPFLDSITKKESEIKSSEISLKALQTQLDTFNQEIEVLTVLKASYKNVKYYIFESTIDELNNRIDKYLTPLFNEDVKVRYEYISGKNSDKLKFETKILKNGTEKSYASLSDGEKCRAKLATNFSLSDIVSLRKSNSFSLMLLDEVFNGLPEECRERVVELLETLKNEKESILIIDHFKAVGTLVEQTIRVEKKNGISRIISG